MPRATLHNRQDSLDRALNLFWQKGFHATSLKDIERALDMRPGSIYATFGSKDGLFQEALECYSARSLREMESLMASHDSPLTALAAYIRKLGGLRDSEVPSRACMLAKSLLELGEREQAARDKVETLLAGMEARFRQAFADARDAGELLDPERPAHQPERLGRRLQAEVMGLRAYAQREGESDAVRQLAEDIAQDIEALKVNNTH
ncbi:helix-turn-helix domain-containing protein [Cobetia marina]|uniref:TetR/AcrR family transcriptional regulator n=1 Tax=Cobetia TaxID=204286 RepID=UPI00244723B9|nr:MULTISPECIES: TetR/AcrR family transcriptional regulator [Cobetia]MDH2292552.1 helix-turn-helix domain containing protein [Cobetia sp. 10Alg 146]MDO6787092.1 helix-turn-helix domain-containing protein [Cobetia marina]